MRGSAAALKGELLTSITFVINLWLAGKCPPSLAPYVASAPLTPLLKPDGGIRPIAVGTIWRRLVSKVAMKSVAKEMSSYLSAHHQFGVGVSGGVEAIIHAVNRYFERYGTDPNMTLALVDFTNAFNLVDRQVMFKEVRTHCPSIARYVEFCYAMPAKLFLGEVSLLSATGVQQGDPLGPLLFALVLQPLIDKVASQCDLDILAFYLDDGSMMGKSLEVAKAFDIIEREGPSYGLFINIKKSEVLSLCSSFDPFPSHIGRPSRGVKLLGGPVSHEKCFCADLVRKRVMKVLNMMESLEQLEDPQMELLLLRACVGMPKMVFALRTTPPDAISFELELFDRGLRNTLQRIIVGDGAGFGEFQWRLSTLPIHLGGLGIYCGEDVKSFAFVASHFQTKPLQDRILGSHRSLAQGVAFETGMTSLKSQLPTFNFSQLSGTSGGSKTQSMLADAHYKMVLTVLENSGLSMRDACILSSLRSTHAQDFLLTVPIFGLGLTMSPIEYRAILKYRMCIPLYPGDEKCPLCRISDLDAFGDHAVHCRTRPGYKFRHDIVRDALFDLINRGGIRAMKEAPVAFLGEKADGLHAQRPADVLIYDWMDGMNACIDVTGVSPLSGLRDSGFKVGQAADDAAKGKICKHDNACKLNQHAFIPFAFDTFGYLSGDAVKLLHRLDRVVKNNLMLDVNSSFSYVFRCISFAIQKGLAAQLVARASSRVFL